MLDRTADEDDDESLYEGTGDSLRQKGTETKEAETTRPNPR